MTDRRPLLLHRLAVAGLGCLAGGAAGSESFVVGPRAEGMGGVGVAAADDGVAQFYNPAMFGFFGYPHGAERVHSDNNDLRRKDWGVAVDLDVGARQGGDLADRLKAISDVDTDALRNTTIVSASQLVDLSKLGNAVVHSDDPGNAVSAFGDAGGTVRVWRLGLGMRTFGESAAYVEQVDLTRVGLPGVGTFEDAVVATAAPESSGLFNPNMLGISPAQLQATRMLDFAARKAGVTAADAPELEVLYQQMQGQFTNDTLKDNQTKVTLRGLGVAEFPVTYGHPLSDHFAVGGSLKLMVGRVYGTRVTIFDGDAADQLKHADDQYHQSTAVGVDLGVVFRIPFLQVGLAGRNLNEPKFAGFTAGADTFPDVTVDRQVTLGVAFIPWSTFVAEIDADLLQVDSLTPGYHTQDLAAGVEWNPWHFLALRGGLSRNLAESDVGLLVHAGLGFNFWAVRLDLAGAVALETQKVGGTDTPREGHVSFGVAVDF